MSDSANIQINLLGNVFTQVEKLQANFTKVIDVVDRVDQTINKMAKNVNGNLKTINLNAVVSNVRNAVDAITNIGAPGIGLEKGVAELSAITGVAGKELDGLVERAREVGVSSGLGAQGAVEAYKLLASQIQVDKIGIEGLNNLHKETITLAQASGMSMADAANSMAGTINQFGLEADAANRVINVLAAGSKYGAAEIPDLAQSFKVVGAAANAAGLNIEQTAGAIEVLSKNNLKGAEAGTALRNIVLKMQTALKVDFKKVGFSDALDALKPKLSDATYLSKLFGMENVAAAQFLITNSAAVKEMTEQVSGTNVAQEQAAITTQTTAFKMQQWRAAIDEAKISMFDLMGSSAGFLTVAGEQMVLLSQLMPLVQGVGSVISWLTKIQNLQKVATIATNIVTGIWTGIQWALNAALWACPLTWIIALIVALVAAIIYMCTCVEGWGEQWDSVVNFAANTWDLFIENIKFAWNTMTNGLMIGLDYIKMGWYKFKEAVGLGDSSENQAALSEISANIDARKKAITDGAKKIAELTTKTANSLEWKLTTKKDDGAASAAFGVPTMPAPAAAPAFATPPPTTTAPAAKVDLNLGGKGGSSSGQSSNVVDLDKIAPQNLKGSSVYNAITSKLASVKLPSLAAAAATIAMPLAIATTTPQIPELPSAPQIEKYADNIDNKDYGRTANGKTFNVKACDKIEIHIDKADKQGYAEIEKRVNAMAAKAAAETMNKILNYEA